MGLTRGSLALPRMNAHRLVIIAAAFTIAVAAALATALVTFSSQALPRAVRHDLSRAAATSFVVRGNVTAGQGAQYTSLLPGKISAALATGCSIVVKAPEETPASPAELLRAFVDAGAPAEAGAIAA